MKSLRLSGVLAACACVFAQTPPSAEKAAAPHVVTQIVNAPGTLPDVPDDMVVVSVGEEKVTARELAEMVETLPEQLRAAARGAGRRRFAENIVNVKLLAREARTKKLDQDAAFRIQAEFQRESLLADRLFRKMAADYPIEEAVSRKYYEEHKRDWEQAKARHILVRVAGSPIPVKAGRKELTDAEALAKIEAIRKKLAGGADFAALAEAESDDAGTATRGGDLGTFKHGQMHPAFEEAAFQLTPGQVSGPVKTPFGYHLIRLESKEAKLFAEVRPEIEARLKPEYAQKQFQDLRKNLTVVFNESYFTK